MPPQKPRRPIRNPDDLVRRLAIIFEIEFGFGAAVGPVRERFEIGASERALGERGALDGDAHPRRLPRDALLLRNRFGRRHHTARDQSLPAFILARENEDRIARGDELAAIHRLLRREDERLRPRIANFGFDRVCHAPPHPQPSVIARFMRATQFCPKKKWVARIALPVRPSHDEKEGVILQNQTLNLQRRPQRLTAVPRQSVEAAAGAFEAGAVGGGLVVEGEPVVPDRFERLPAAVRLQFHCAAGSTPARTSSFNCVPSFTTYGGPSFSATSG